jgi:hypothetical protein
MPLGTKPFGEHNEIQPHHLVHQRASKGWVRRSRAERPCHDVNILFIQQAFKPFILNRAPLRRAVVEKPTDHSVGLTRATGVRAIM